MPTGPDVDVDINAGGLSFESFFIISSGEPLETTVPPTPSRIFSIAGITDSSLMNSVRSKPMMHI